MTAIGGPLAPGSTVGILGGGQLGRYLAIAAAKLGYRAHIYAPETDPPAGQVAAAVTQAAFDDEPALAAFADAVDAVTLEFENVPVASVRCLAERVPVRPGATILEIAQDRLAEKRFAAACGAGTAPWVPLEATDDLAGAAALAAAGPTILKTARLGYDGKGQVALPAHGDVAAAWDRLGRVPAILEGRVALARELSVLIARGTDGDWVAVPPVENRHEDGILRTTVAPAAVSASLAEDAVALARALAEASDTVGLLAVEFFVTDNGALLVNEMAPRPHNSGHWTLDAAKPDQFDLAIRAAVGLPLPPVRILCPAEMTNLLGEEAGSWADLAAEPGVCLHLYGKPEARPGRKMGHVTRLKPSAP